MWTINLLVAGLLGKALFPFEERAQNLNLTLMAAMLVNLVAAVLQLTHGAL